MADDDGGIRLITQNMDKGTDVADRVIIGGVTPQPLTRKDDGDRRPDNDEDEAPSASDMPVLHDLPAEWSGTPILCVAGKGAFDGAAAAMLAQLLAKHGLGCRLEADAAVSSTNIARLNGAGVKTVCLSLFDLGTSTAHLRYSLQRIRRRIPEAAVVICLWGRQEQDQREHLEGIDGVLIYVFSLREALNRCIEMVQGRRDEPRATPDSIAEAARISEIRAAPGTRPQAPAA